MYYIQRDDAFGTAENAARENNLDPKIGQIKIYTIKTVEKIGLSIDWTIFRLVLKITINELIILNYLKGLITEKKQ